MKINGREVIVKADFADMLDEIATWFIADDRIQASQDFVQAVYDTMVNKIAPSPEKYGEYPWKRTPTKLYRLPFQEKMVHHLQGLASQVRVSCHCLFKTRFV